jgi:hypothetical protein
MGNIAITKTDTINTSAERVWEILSGEFTDISSWARNVAHSKARESADTLAVGGGRVCEVPGFGLTDERFTRYDESNKTFSFSVEAEKIPGFFKNMESTWKVVPTGPNKSVVSTKIAGNATGVMGALVGPMMKRKFNGTLDQIYEDLRVYAETGEVSEAKLDARAKHEQKAHA